MNKPVTTIKVHTTQPATIVANRQTVETVYNQAKITVARSPDTIEIIVITDTAEKTIKLSSINSFAYYANIPGNYGIGMLFEKNNDKRYTYPPNIFINFSDTTTGFQRYPLLKKGNLYLDISVPYINHFYFVPAGEPAKSHSGFLGLSAGVDYYYRNNRFLSVKASTATDYLVPFPVGVDYSGEQEAMSSSYLTLSNNFHIKRFSVGYGLSFSRNTWKFVYHNRFNPPPPTREPVSKSSYGIGFTFPVRYQIGKTFAIGLHYRPTLFNFSGETAYRYEHLVSFDFGWRFLNK